MRERVSIKQFLTYEQQIERLVEKGLVIGDADEARQSLQDVGYFTLVNGYKQLLCNPMTRKYKPNVSFSDIAAIYEFDNSLRELLSHNLTYVERKLRSAIAYAFCEHYGSSQTAYLDVANYSKSPKHAQGIAKLIKMLDSLASKNNEHEYIVHHRRVHKNVPLWVLVNATTFGQMSKMYSFLDHNVKASVAKRFEHVNEKELEQFLKVLVLYRNVCAHGERLLTHKAYSDIPDTCLHRKLDIGMKGSQYVQGKRDLFAVVIALRYLLPKDRFIELKKALIRLIDRYLAKNSAVERDELYELMGFPKNWKRITRFKI